jgi:hypothetical protein
MNVPAMNAKTLRAVRWLQIAGLLLSTADLVRDLLRGYQGDAIFAAVLIAFWSLMLCAQKKLIHRREELERPRPDYAAIAAMEREVYGETFEHEGAPKRHQGFELSAPEIMREARSALRKPPKPRRPTFEDDRRAMRALGEARRAAMAHAGECGMCGYGEARAGGMCASCYRQWREHCSNLRGERPS